MRSPRFLPIIQNNSSNVNLKSIHKISSNNNMLSSNTSVITSLQSQRIINKTIDKSSTHTNNTYLLAPSHIK